MASMFWTVYTLITLVIHGIIPKTAAQQVETNPEILVVKSIKSIGAGIGYFTRRETVVDTYELLGLRVAADSLLETVENCVGSSALSVPEAILEEVKMLCAKLNVLIPRVLNIYNPSNLTKGYKNFISRHLSSFRSYRPLEVDKDTRNKLETLDGVDAHDFQICLGELSQMNTSHCSISKNCWKVLQPKIAEESSIPFQAMVLSMAELLGCTSEINQKWEPVTISGFVENICYSLYPKVSSFHASEILPETEEIESFLEAFFACSLLGFEDFLQVTHMRLPAVVHWQLSSGCFGVETPENPTQTETCMPRMSSAAIGQLGLYLKWLMNPKGYAAATGELPFPSYSWLSRLKFLLLVPLVAFAVMRKPRRLLWSALRWIMIFFKSTRRS